MRSLRVLILQGLFFGQPVGSSFLEFLLVWLLFLEVRGESLLKARRHCFAVCSKRSVEREGGGLNFACGDVEEIDLKTLHVVISQHVGIAVGNSSDLERKIVH